jgi:hypothetical protein
VLAVAFRDDHQVMNLDDDELVGRLMNDESIMGFDYTADPKCTVSYLKMCFDSRSMDYTQHSVWWYTWPAETRVHLKELDAVIVGFRVVERKLQRAQFPSCWKTTIQL